MSRCCVCPSRVFLLEGECAEEKQVVRSPGRMETVPGPRCAPAGSAKGASAVPLVGAMRLLQLLHSAALRLCCCARLVPRDGSACSGTGSQAETPGGHKFRKLNGHGRF